MGNSLREPSNGSDRRFITRREYQHKCWLIDELKNRIGWDELEAFAKFWKFLASVKLELPKTELESY